MKYSSLKLYTNEQKVSVNGRETKLEPKVYEVLIYLIHKNGNVASKTELLENVWKDTIVTEHSLNKSISKLRKIFNDNPTNSQVIETISKRGYRLLIPIKVVEDRSKDHSRRILNMSSLVGLVLFTCISVISFYLYQTYSGPRITSGTIKGLAPITSSPGIELMPDFSSDGLHLIYIKYSENLDRSNIFMRDMVTNESKQITDQSDFITFPKFSFNGKYIAYHKVFKDGRSEIQSITLQNKDVQTITGTRTRMPKGLDWSSDGSKILYADIIPETQTYALFEHAIKSNTSTQLTFPKTNIMGDVMASYSPDGNNICFIRKQSSDIAHVGILNTNISKGNGIQLYPENNVSKSKGLCWSPNGNSILFFSNSRGNYHLNALDFNGSIRDLGIVSNYSENKDPVISNNGEQLAFVQFVKKADIFSAAIADNSINSIEIIGSTRSDLNAQIAPIDSKILFCSDRNGFYNLWTSEKDGGDSKQITFFNSEVDIAPKWSPDNKNIVFTLPSDDKSAVYIMKIPDGLPQKILDDALDPSFSKNGDWILYRVISNGISEVKKISLKTKEVVSLGIKGGAQPIAGPFPETVFFIQPNDTGIWMKQGANNPTKIIEEFYDHGKSDWSVTDTGIYYLIYDKDYLPFLRHYDFETKKISHLGKISDTPIFIKGISVANNTLVYSIDDESESDILLIEFEM